MGFDAIGNPVDDRTRGAEPSRLSVGLVVEADRVDGPVARALVAGFMDELETRYAANGPADGDAHEISGAWALRVEQVTSPQGLFVVARLDGVPVGCGAIRPLVETPTGHLIPGLRAPTDASMPGPPGGHIRAIGEIKRMYTVPAARRRGVSRAVLARLEAEAARLGYGRLQLETGVRQPEALALYESAGYHRIPTYGPYEGDELSVCFAKNL